MQKLVWKNSIGDEINLTSGNYGITEWEGFSNTSLNIQSQQVPFQDGGVFLDALMEQRELSVTLAMNDGGNLETRYRLRRELIHALNPKLGEGYLIYTNDFISKRIKCVAQIPLFETHNSNDSGTPKASLAWTACEPYWEDIEETTVFVELGEIKEIENEGDIPTNVKINLYGNVENPTIENRATNKNIKLDTQIAGQILIDTNLGNKSVFSEKSKTDIVMNGSQLYNIIYVEKYGKYYTVGTNNAFSVDSIHWEWSTSPIVAKSIAYSEELDLFVIVGDSGAIYSSTDFENWTKRTSHTTQGLNSVTYSSELHLFMAVGKSGVILSSSNGTDWTNITTSMQYSAELEKVIYSSDINKFVIVGKTGVVITSDGSTWNTVQSASLADLYSISYSEELNLYVAVGSDGYIFKSSDLNNSWEDVLHIYSQFNDVFYASGVFVAVNESGKIYTSNDGTNWGVKASKNSSLEGIVYSYINNIFVVVGAYGKIITSYNNIDWETVAEYPPVNFYSIAYSKDKNLFIATYYSSGDYRIMLSNDGINWNPVYVEGISLIYKIIYVEEWNMFVAVGAVIATTIDGYSWNVITDESFSGLRSVAYSKKYNMLVAVGLSGKIVTSSDGENWNTITPVTNYNLYGVTYSDEKDLFVVVGDYGTILTSTTGTNWTARTSYYYNLLYDVTYGDNKFVITGRSGFQTSTDGINWKGIGITGGWLEHIIYIKELHRYIAIGSSRICTSYDGENWNDEVISLNAYYTGITYASDYKKIFIVGQNTTMITMEDVPNENKIQNLSSTSDMNFNLDLGKNEILLSRKSGSFFVSISYRQKYIGV